MPSLPQRLSRSRYRLTSEFPLLPSHAWGIPPPTRADHLATRLVAYARPGTGLTMLIKYNKLLDTVGECRGRALKSLFHSSPILSSSRG